ncbi:MAG: hypothetical protein IT384_29265 [Deltaproteobacteria bacterium]|nr:hypothetical protein [Deltaproteobacteria bacterium]
MIPGLNHNIRYRERVFHVQTEDSGLIRQQLTTHIFLDGSVIAHERSTYEGKIEAGLEELARNSAIRKIMQDQHKGLLRRLVKGEFDDVLVRIGVLQPTSKPPPRVSVTPRTSSKPPAPTPALSSRPPSVPAMTRGAGSSPPPPAHAGRPLSAPPAAPAPAYAPSPAYAPAPSPLPLPLPVPQPLAARGAPPVPRPSVPPSPGPTAISVVDSIPPPAIAAALASSMDSRPPIQRGPKIIEPPVSSSIPTLKGGAAIKPAVQRSASGAPPPARRPPADPALRWGHTLVDALPVLPTEATQTEPPSANRHPATVPTPPALRGFPPIHDARTIVEPRSAPPPTRAKRAEVGHDTILDLSGPPDMHERRTDPPPPPSARPRPEVPGATARAAGRAPTDPRARAGIKVFPQPGQQPSGLLEDPSIEDALLGLNPIEESVLDMLDSSPPGRRSRDPELLTTDPEMRGLGPTGAPIPPGRKPSVPTSSPPGAAWLDAAAELSVTSPGGSPRGAPGPRPWMNEIPSIPPAPPRRPPPPPPSDPNRREPTGRPGSVAAGRWRLPDHAAPGPDVPAWPPPDADLEQFVRNSASLIPEPDDPQYAITRDPPPGPPPPRGQTPTPPPRAQTPPPPARTGSGRPIRIEERSLDDIILGYLSTKQRR